ncbi:hypothetical protein HG536_0H02500 [Torulaspora globosa]|uniref:Nucleoporin Nup133/Nup155-like N-terminal domain-containing protein n=1 Tax=Torulaspora globosa TaxID=48254 RepID=A0A7G3ZMY9_9SACH|nr:uncharacterized protein HG536_0H02500 [Torulaspora globosa]QLL34875.1 hypothetical protein HG536_0H02500 [Torulaspora globosa]
MSAGRPLFQLRKEIDTSAALPENDVEADDSTNSVLNNASTSGYYSSLMESSNECHHSQGRFNNERILTENDKYVVKRLAPDLSSRPLEGDKIEGVVDTFLGKALVGDVNNLYIWDYHSTQKHVNVSRIPLHQEHEVLNVAPKCLFTRPSAIDESTQMLIDGSAGSSGGVCIIHRKNSEFIYYEDIESINNLHLQLSKNKAHSLNLHLKDGETVTIATNCEPAGIVIATSFGRVLFATIRDSSGKPKVQLKQQLIKSQRGLLFRSFSRYKEVISVKNGPIVGRGERLIYVVTKEGNFQTWHLSVGINCFRRVEVNVFQQILDSLQDLYPFAHGTLQILDSHPLFADLASAHLILSSIQNDKETYYILTTILLDEKTKSFTIFSTYRLNTYVLPFDDSHKPQLYVPSSLEAETRPTTTVFILFSDAVVLTQVSSNLDSTYSFRRKWEDIISFRSDVKIIGSGFNSESLYLMDNQISVFEISLIDKGETANSDDIGFIKSHIDQAVYFSKVYSSPIEFNLPKELTLENEEVEKDLRSSGNEIFFSTGKYIPPMLNTLGQHLRLRMELYDNLLNFVSDNFNYKISPFTKLDLLERYEIMKCCYSLLEILERSSDLAGIWSYILSGCENGLKMEDLVRNHLDKFPHLFTEFLSEVATRSASLASDTFRVETALFLSNCFYDAVLDQGERVLRYGTLNLDPLELNRELPWFSNLRILKAVNSIFFDFKFSLTTVTEKEEQWLIVMIKILYYCFHQANLWFNESENRKESPLYNEIQVLYESNHLSWAQVLCEYGLQEFSIQIADFYNDMGSLVETLETLDFSSSKDVYDKYFSKMGYEFAATLFNYYVEHNKLKELFTRFPEQHTFLLRFLGSSEQYGDVAWIQDILDERYDQATNTLSQIAVGDAGLKESVGKRQFHLSIAKLSALVQDNGQLNDTKINRIQEDLDIIDGQNDLFHRISEIGIKIASRFEHTELDSVFALLAEKLKAKNCLKLELIVEMYSMLNDAEAPYCALKLLAFENNTLSHETKRFLISTVWRRCVLTEHQWSNVTDATQTVLYRVLRRFFEEELYVSGCPLPSLELLTDRALLNKAYLTELYQGLDVNLDKIHAILEKELESVQQHGHDFEDRIKSIIGTALEASGNKCPVNYESNTVEYC